MVTRSFGAPWRIECFGRRLQCRAVRSILSFVDGNWSHNVRFCALGDGDGVQDLTEIATRYGYIVTVPAEDLRISADKNKRNEESGMRKRFYCYVCRVETRHDM